MKKLTLFFTLCLSSIVTAQQSYKIELTQNYSDSVSIHLKTVMQNWDKFISNVSLQEIEVLKSGEIIVNKDQLNRVFVQMTEDERLATSYGRRDGKIGTITFGSIKEARKMLSKKDFNFIFSIGKKMVVLGKDKVMWLRLTFYDKEKAKRYEAVEPLIYDDSGIKFDVILYHINPLYNGMMKMPFLYKDWGK